MSIIRLSMLEDGLYAPDARGVVSYTGPFSLARRGGRRGLDRMGNIARQELPGRGDPLQQYLGRALKIEDANAPDDPCAAPLVVLVNGFQYDPSRAYFDPPHHPKADNPHCRIYHFKQHDQDIEMRYHSTGWPRGLGIEDGDGGADGLAIGFGWDSDPSPLGSLLKHGLNHYAVAYQRAEDAAWHLVAVLDQIVRLRPGRPINLFCHSLGSRVVVRAIARAADRDLPKDLKRRLHPIVEAINRVIILAGAEKVMEAQLMMRRLYRTLNAPDPETSLGYSKIPAFYNVVSRENDVLDHLGENFMPSSPGSKQVIGHNGLEANDPNWLDIQLDDDIVAAWFKKHVNSYQVSGDNTSGLLTVWDHWIHYTWRENMRVYKDILRDRSNWQVSALKKMTYGKSKKIVFDSLRIGRR